MITTKLIQMYWLINMALIINYLFMTCFSNWAAKNKTVSQHSQLVMLRTIFITTLLIFSFSPFLISFIPFDKPIILQFAPLPTAITATPHPTFVTSIARHLTMTTSPSSKYAASWQLLFYIALGYFFAQATRQLYQLKQLTRKAYPLHKIHRIHILLSNSIQIPFCWSSFCNHYVILPHDILLNRSDFLFTLRHEFQHIRQGDTHWNMLLILLKTVCFLNPTIWLMTKQFQAQQEFACDENLVMQRNHLVLPYAGCLLNIARTAVNDKRRSLLYCQLIGNHQSNMLSRRVTMLFNYQLKPLPFKRLCCVYLICCLIASSLAWAVTSNNQSATLTAQTLASMVNQSRLPVTICEEVLHQINTIRQNEHARNYMALALKRMQAYEPYIRQQLKDASIPDYLVALPLVESGYRPLEAEKNPLQAAGIWQFIPSTAKQYGLVVNKTRDDRLNTKLSTHAAITYLKQLYTQFHDWKLAVIAYEIGEAKTAELISALHTRDAWQLVRRAEEENLFLHAKQLKSFLSMFDASIVIMHHPDLVKNQA